MTFRKDVSYFFGHDNARVNIHKVSYISLLGFGDKCMKILAKLQMERDGIITIITEIFPDNANITVG